MAGKLTNIGGTVLRSISAVIFVVAGAGKLAGLEEVVVIFDQIGLGQWFRYLTAFVEIGGGVMMFVPGLMGVAGLMLACTMAVAVLLHLFVIGGSAFPALALLVVTGLVAILYRADIARLLGRAPSA